MKPVDLDRAAESDLLEITAYLLSVSQTSTAERFIASFWSVVEDLRQFPELGQRSIRDPEMRVLRRGVYRFIYQVRDDRVILLQILDGRAQPGLP